MGCYVVGLIAAGSLNQECHEKAEVEVLQFEVKRMTEVGNLGMVEEKGRRGDVVGSLCQDNVG